MKVSSNLLENYEYTEKLALDSFTENCRKGCVSFEECEDAIFCGSLKWEHDEWGNMVDFEEEKHCDYKTA